MRFIQLLEDTRKLINGSDRGRFNEIILAVAIFSKFVRGTKDIDANYVKSALALLAKSPTGLRNKKNPDNDPIRLFIQDQGEVITKDIQDVKNIELMSSEIEGNTRFANSDTTADRLAKIYAENGKPDEVVVSQMGGARSKTDVLLQYANPDGTFKTLKPYSAKTFSPRLDNTDVNSIDQLNSYMDNFGIRLNAKGLIKRSASSKELFKTSFDSVAAQMNVLLQQDNDNNERKFLQQVIDFIQEVGTRGDSSLLLVDIKKGDFSSHDFSLLAQNLDKVNLEVKSVLPKGMPSIYIYDKNLGVAQGLLLQIRYTYSEPRVNSKGKQLTGRHRLFADGGPLFKNLTRIIYNQKDK